MKFRLSFRKIAVILFLFNALPLSLFSEDLTNKELNEKIKQAQAFFDDREYDKAIQILTEVVENNPDRLDQAVALMDKITDIRNQYNELYEELIDTLYVEEDPGRALELIEEMEAIEKNPNERAREMIANARISAELVVNKIRLREIMDEAKMALDSKEYSDALILYNSGFKLGRQTYEESELVSEIEKNTVKRIISEIQEDAASYLTKGQNLISQINSLKNIIATSAPEEVGGDINGLIASFNQFSAERDVFLNKGNVIDDSLETIVAINKNAPERFFLDFSSFLIYGRSDNEFYEGIISTTDLFWEDQFSDISGIIDRQMNSSYQSSIRAYDSGNFEEALSDLEDTLNYAKYSIQIYEALNKRLTIDQNLKLDQYSAYIVGKYYGNLVDARILARVTDSYNKMITLREGFSDYNLTGEQSLDRLYTLRLQIVDDLPILDEEELLWDTIGGSINWLESYNAEPESAQAVYNLVRSDIRSLRNEMNEINLAILIRLTDQEYARITNALSDFRNIYNDNRQIIEGISDSDVISYTGDDQIKSTFPQRALPNLVVLFDDLGQLSENARQIIDTFELSGIDIAAGSAIEEFLMKMKLVLPEIDALSESVETLEILARDNLFTAEGLENQGNKLIENVQNIIDNSRSVISNLNQADTYLKDASSVFIQSYSFKENLDLRRYADSTISQLQEDLFGRKLELYVDDIQNLINQGIAQYKDNQYSRSRNTLERANNMWEEINPNDDNPQIQYWLGRVKIALEFDIGRTINRNEPLYNEMIQFLNHANSNYELGASFIIDGETEKGLEALNKAIYNIESVELYQPKNESAGLLRLLIEQIRDPGLFRTNFTGRVNSAWSKVQSSNKELQDDGLAELEILSAIDASFPGLESKIYQAEIITGKREEPKDPRVIAESKRLTDQAEDIIEGGIKSQYDTAKGLLNKAISLNIENTRASSLLFQIQSDIGGPSLPRELAAKFKEAEDLFTLKNYINSYKIVLELKKDPRSAKYQPLLDLEEKLISELGI